MTTLSVFAAAFRPAVAFGLGIGVAWGTANAAVAIVLVILFGLFDGWYAWCARWSWGG